MLIGGREVCVRIMGGYGGRLGGGIPFLCVVSFLVVATGVSAQQFTIQRGAPDGPDFRLDYDSLTTNYYILYAGSTPGTITNTLAIRPGTAGQDSIYDLGRMLQDDMSYYYRVRSISTNTPQDIDQDGMSDVYELGYGFLSPFNPGDAMQDFDGDRLSNLFESQWGSSPADVDTDLDSIYDHGELSILASPVVSNTLANTTYYLGYTNKEGVIVYYEEPPGGQVTSAVYSNLLGNTFRAAFMTGRAVYKVTVFDGVSNGGEWNNTNIYMYFESTFDRDDWILSLQIETAMGERFLVYDPGTQFLSGWKDGINIKYSLDLETSQYSPVPLISVQKVWRNLEYDLFPWEPSNTFSYVRSAFLEMGTNMSVRVHDLSVFGLSP
ncbi:MAG: hypothetical protein KJ626_07685 [Verrucomicrobia bacterium]|nr:hypothetical protein [Verrucomicrobiota bacterium]